MSIDRRIEGTLRLVKRDECLRHFNDSCHLARAKLLASGKLSTIHYAPADAVALPDEELQRLGTLLPGSPSLDQIIDEDRGQR